MLENNKIKTFDQFTADEFNTLFDRVMERTGKLLYSCKPDGLKLAKQSEHRFVQAFDKDGRLGFYDSFTEGELKEVDNTMLVINSYINWEFDEWDCSAAVVQFSIVQFDDNLETVNKVLSQRYFRCATNNVGANCQDLLVMLNTCISRREYIAKGVKGNAKA